MSTAMMHVEAGKFLENLRVSRNEKKTAVSERVRRSKSWVDRVERGDFNEQDVELIIHAYGLNGAKQKELQLLLRKELQQVVAMADAV